MEKKKKSIIIIISTILYSLSLFITYLTSSAIIKTLGRVVFREIIYKLKDQIHNFILNLWIFSCAIITAVILAISWSTAAHAIKKIYISMQQKNQ
jgi:hypothetical protein